MQDLQRSYKPQVSLPVLFYRYAFYHVHVKKNETETHSDVSKTNKSIFFKRDKLL